jgi:outer membrane protease E
MRNIYFFLILVIMQAASVYAENLIITGIDEKPSETVNGVDGEGGIKNAAPGEPQKRGYAFSVSPVAGIFWGRAEEIVYKSGGDDYLSQLLWDFKPLFYTGAEIEFGPGAPFTKSGFTAAVSAAFGFPFQTGAVEDWDWLDPDDDFLTNYSRHDVFSNGAFWIEASVGYSWAFFSKFAFGVYGEFSYLRFSWDAEDGYLQYAGSEYDHMWQKQYEPWSPSLPKENIYGTGIRYAQNWRIFTPGIFVSFRASRYIRLNLSAGWTPFINGACRDDHLLRNYRFEDYFSGGYSLKGMFDLVFLAGERTAFSLSAGGRVIDSIQGETYAAKTGEGVTGVYMLSQEKSGAGLMVLDVSFSAKVQF